MEFGILGSRKDRHGKTAMCRARENASSSTAAMSYESWDGRVVAGEDTGAQKFRLPRCDPGEWSPRHASWVTEEAGFQPGV